MKKSRGTGEAVFPLFPTYKPWKLQLKNTRHRQKPTMENRQINIHKGSFFFLTIGPLPRVCMQESCTPDPISVYVQDSMHSFAASPKSRGGCQYKYNTSRLKIALFPNILLHSHHGRF